MKKMISIVLAATMALSLAACGSTAKPAAVSTKDAYSAGLNERGFYEGVTASDHIQLPDDFEHITVKAEQLVSDDEGVNDFIQTITNDYGEKVQKDAAEAAVIGDWVTVDFVGTVDGYKFKGGSAENQTVQLGSGMYIDGFEEQIAGHKKGETFDVTVTFPKDYPSSEDENGTPLTLSEKEVVFSITLDDISYHELTDEDVKKCFEENKSTMLDGTQVETIEQAREYYKEREHMGMVENLVMAYLMQNIEMKKPIPQKLIDDRIALEKTFTDNLAKSAGFKDGDEMAKNSGYESLDAYLKENEFRLVQDVQYRLTLQAVAEQLNISVNEDEIRRYASGGDYEASLEEYGFNRMTQTALDFKTTLTLCNNIIVSNENLSKEDLPEVTKESTSEETTESDSSSAEE